MRNFKVLAPVVAAGLTAASFVMSAPAQADSATIKDASSDVQVMTMTNADTEPAVVIDPGNTEEDITRAVIKHGRHRIKVVVHVRDLRPRKVPTLEVLVKTNHGMFVALLYRVPITGATLDVMPLDSQNEEPSTCSGSRKSYKPALNIVSFSVPRRCLDNPRWIRARVGLSDVSFLDGATPDDFTLIQVQDVAGPTGKVPMLFTKNSTTPKLFRG